MLGGKPSLAFLGMLNFTIFPDFNACFHQAFIIQERI